MPASRSRKIPDPPTQNVVSDAGGMTKEANEEPGLRIALHFQGLRVRVDKTESGTQSATIVMNLICAHPGSSSGIRETQCEGPKDFLSSNC